MSETKEKKPRKALKIIGLILGILLGIILILFIILLAAEYRPKDIAELELSGKGTQTLSSGDALTVMTWNTGYGGLGEDADFFMDGGTNVMSADKAQVEENLAGIQSQIQKTNPDVVLLQEVDKNSKRTYHIDEIQSYEDALPGYQTTYAPNYKALYVPYPLKPTTIGKVNAGQLTLSKYSMSEAERQSLPVSFSWPVSAFNLKRCLLVSRIPVEGTDKELVLVNLHLEAYDSGEGKIAQTKQLKTLLETEAKKGNYVIAGGDFNQSFSNFDNRDYPLISDKMWAPGQLDASEFDDNLRCVADNSVPSCRSLDRPLSSVKDTDPELFQYYMIDGFIISNNLSVNSLKTLDLQFKYSDHNPMVLKVTLK
ncbi:MAG TPA: endonuclease/exonuclease/phosphatase family protein [Clostridiales bacterium]|nr:endonuclease/exonuclease/phosphatase family protein [Clostridiales bacterium]